MIEGIVIQKGKILEITDKPKIVYDFARYLSNRSYVILRKNLKTGVVLSFRIYRWDHTTPVLQDYKAVDNYELFASKIFYAKKDVDSIGRPFINVEFLY